MDTSAAITLQKKMQKSSSIGKIKHSRAHILWKGKTSSGKEAIPPFHRPDNINRSMTVTLPGVAVLYCRKGAAMPRAPNIDP